MALNTKKLLLLLLGLVVILALTWTQPRATSDIYNYDYARTFASPTSSGGSYSDQSGGGEPEYHGPFVECIDLGGGSILYSLFNLDGDLHTNEYKYPSCYNPKTIVKWKCNRVTKDVIAPESYHENCPRGHHCVDYSSPGAECVPDGDSCAAVTCDPGYSCFEGVCKQDPRPSEPPLPENPTCYDGNRYHYACWGSELVCELSKPAQKIQNCPYGCIENGDGTANCEGDTLPGDPVPTPTDPDSIPPAYNSDCSCDNKFSITCNVGGSIITSPCDNCVDNPNGDGATCQELPEEPPVIRHQAICEQYEGYLTLTYITYDEDGEAIDYHVITKSDECVGYPGPGSDKIQKYYCIYDDGYPRFDSYEVDDRDDDDNEDFDDYTNCPDDYYCEDFGDLGDACVPPLQMPEPEGAGEDSSSWVDTFLGWLV